MFATFINVQNMFLNSIFCSIQISQAVGCVISALQRVNQLKEHIDNHHYIVVLTHV